jgi:very-short-patch-repair endonuclease
LWEELRDKKLGYKFFRKFAVKSYVLDFYCPEKKLGIELDGGGHRNEETKQYDKTRGQFLTGLGIKIVRL